MMMRMNQRRARAHCCESKEHDLCDVERSMSVDLQEEWVIFCAVSESKEDDGLFHPIYNRL